MPFFFMVGGMLAIAVTLIVVTVRRAMDTPPEYRSALFRSGDYQQNDTEASAGRGSGFQG